MDFGIDTRLTTLFRNRKFSAESDLWPYLQRGRKYGFVRILPVTCRPLEETLATVNNTVTIPAGAKFEMKTNTAG
jgi:hypothetical protein